MKRTTVALVISSLAITVAFSAAVFGDQRIPGAEQPEQTASKDRGSVERKDTFGTDDEGFTAVAGTDFFPGDSSVVHNTFSGEERYCSSGAPSTFLATVQGLPHGATLEFMDFWYHDSSGSNLTVELYEVCRQDFDPAQTSETVLDSFASSGTDGDSFYLGSVSIGRPIDTQSCVYQFRATLDACSSFLTLTKGRLQWQRAVSPAPGSATFGDVGTGHPFFQHVEALASSGITAGCGSGNFCPDDPLTRGQMAVFLAKALGLHFTTITQP